MNVRLVTVGGWRQTDWSPKSQRTLGLQRSQDALAACQIPSDIRRRSLLTISFPEEKASPSPCSETAPVLAMIKWSLTETGGGDGGALGDGIPQDSARLVHTTGIRRAKNVKLKVSNVFTGPKRCAIFLTLPPFKHCESRH